MPSEQVSRLSWKWKKPFSAKIVGRERMRTQRKHCTAKGQVVILRRHFLEKVRVSDLCEDLHLQPTVLYLGKRIYSRTEQPPFSPIIAPSASCRRGRKGSNSCRKKSRPKMLGADVVAVSPASVWRVLEQAGLLLRSKGKASRRRIGFEQPLQPHQHWHIDVSYINLF